MMQCCKTGIYLELFVMKIRSIFKGLICDERHFLWILGLDGQEFLIIHSTNSAVQIVILKSQDLEKGLL